MRKLYLQPKDLCLFIWLWDSPQVSPTQPSAHHESWVGLMNLTFANFFGWKRKENEAQHSVMKSW